MPLINIAPMIQVLREGLNTAKILIWDDLALARPQKLSFEDVKVEF